MTVYEIPNINNCNVEEIGSPAIGYRITAHSGWCIHTTAHNENEYARVIAIPATYDMSTIEIVDINTLPENAEIHGGNDNNVETA
jgi:hypothetical protein